MPIQITFGIEIECYIPASVGHAGVARALRAAGLNAQEAAYSGRNYDRWQIKSDASLQEAPRGYVGVEVVSPVLTWGDATHEDAIRTVSEYLVSIDAKVNRTCGGHVHMSVGHLSANGLATLVETYTHNLHAIAPLIAPHRRDGGRWAGIDAPHMLNGAAMIRRDGNVAQVQRIGHHACVINPDWYGQRGTLEFRHRDSTINHYKWLGWVGFLVSLVRYAEENDMPTVWGSTDSMLAAQIESEYLTETLRDWALRNVPEIAVAPGAALIEAREQARAAHARVSRLLTLQGVSA